MEVLPKIIPISQLRQRQSDVLKNLPDGPVVLTQHGRAMAVMVSPDQWNHIDESLAEVRQVLEPGGARPNMVMGR